MTVVLLIRHGRTAANVSGVLAGWSPGVDLDDKGREQVQSLAERLASLPVSAVISSPLDRCRQTAEALLVDRDEVPLHNDDRLGEVRYGDWTGQPLKQLAKLPLWKTVQSHPSGVVFPGDGGESMAAMQSRAVSAVREWNERLGHGCCLRSRVTRRRHQGHPRGCARPTPRPVSANHGRPRIAQRGAVRRQPAIRGTHQRHRWICRWSKPPKRRRSRKKSDDAVVGGGAGA